LVGAKAGGWSVSAPYVPPEQLRSLNDIITSSAEEAGRDPERIVRLYNLMGLITPDGRDMFNGPVARWVDTLTTLYTEYQMNTFIFWPSGDRDANPGFSPRRLCPRRARRSPVQQPSQAAVGEVHHVRTMRLLPSAAKAGKHAVRGRSGRSRPALPMQTYGLDACLLAVVGVANGAESS
jgi:hypothetical protein